MKWVEKIDERMSSKGSRAKSIWQFVKFNAVSLLAGIIQLVLLNVLVLVLQNWKTPLPAFLQGIFSEKNMGEGNSNWGYVLPFLLSNLTANIVAYVINRKSTFSSDAPPLNFIIFLVVFIALMLFSTWFQGLLTHAIRESSAPFWQKLYKVAPTLAALGASLVQFAVLYPLEKFVLLKEAKKK